MSARCSCGARFLTAAGIDAAPNGLRSMIQARSFSSSAPRPKRELRGPRRARIPRPESMERMRIDKNNMTVLRMEMFEWLYGAGKKLRQPLKGSTNYLGAYNRSGTLTRVEKASSRGPRNIDANNEDPLEMELEAERQKQQRDNKGPSKDSLPPEMPSDLRPFPRNNDFRSQPVLSEPLREEVWRRVRVEGHDVTLVSSSLGVTAERVAAVVRMKEIEKRWQQEGKPLATPYNNAVLAMLPTTPFSPTRPPVAHESINDLRVTKPTKSQLFHPVSESRAFTRVDAGVAFDEELLPADKRIPHPELVLAEQDRLSGMSISEQAERAAERMRVDSERRDEARRRRQEKQQRETKVVSAGRWDFMFREMNAEAVGKDGRSETAVGWRYGVPHQDRKKGQVKIPTRVL